MMGSFVVVKKKRRHGQYASTGGRHGPVSRIGMGQTGAHDSPPIFHAVDSSKCECKMSSKTYGPAQCKVADVRVGSATVPNSYTAGWVFLVPVADA